jgi:serine kinase of HPr protein (carbohydrate metabolism regulator)
MTDHAYTVDCVAYGVSFQLIAESGQMLARMRQHAPFGTEVGIGATEDAKRFAILGRFDDSRYSFSVDDEITAETMTVQPLLDQLASDLILYVADRAADRIFLHAGVVGWQGKALILPGRSFAGKTTLVAELVRAGATYYSDEYAVLDEQGCVHAYARDLQMREVGGTGQRSVSIAQLNGIVGVKEIPVSNIVFAEYVDGGNWMPEPVSAGLAALEMMRHTIPVQRAPQRVMATLAKVMETASAVKSNRGEASETVPIMLASMPDPNRPI